MCHRCAEWENKTVPTKRKIRRIHTAIGLLAVCSFGLGYFYNIGLLFLLGMFLSPFALYAIVLWDDPGLGSNSLGTTIKIRFVDDKWEVVRFANLGVVNGKINWGWEVIGVDGNRETALLQAIHKDRRVGENLEYPSKRCKMLHKMMWEL